MGATFKHIGADTGALTSSTTTSALRKFLAISELVIILVSDLDTRELYKLNLVDRTFRNVFQPFLYGSITLRGGLSVEGLSQDEPNFWRLRFPPCHLKVFQPSPQWPSTTSILSNSQLARYCRELSMVFNVPDKLAWYRLAQMNADQPDRADLEPVFKAWRKDDILSAELDSMVTMMPSLETLRWIGLPLSSSLLASLPYRCSALKTLVLCFAGTSPYAAHQLDRGIVSRWEGACSPNFCSSADVCPCRIDARYAASEERWYSSLIQDRDGFIHLPRFTSLAHNPQPVIWGLRSLTFRGIPRLRDDRWDTALAQLLRISPQLTELSLEMSYETIRHFRETRGSPWVQPGAHFIYALCQRYSSFGSAPLSLSRLELAGELSLTTLHKCSLNDIGHYHEPEPSVAWDSDPYLASAHDYLSKLTDLKVLESVYLPANDYRTNRIQETWGIGTFTREHTPRLRTLSLELYSPQLAFWLRYSDPDFLKQVAVLVPQRGRYWPPLRRPKVKWMTPLTALPRMVSMTLPVIDHDGEWDIALSVLDKGSNLEGLSLQFDWANAGFFDDMTKDSDSLRLAKFVATRLSDKLAGLPCLQQFWIQVVASNAGSVQRVHDKEILDRVARLVTWMARQIVRARESQIQYVALDWDSTPLIGVDQVQQAWRIGQGRDGEFRYGRSERIQLDAIAAQLSDDSGLGDLGDGWIRMGVKEISDVELFRGMVPLEKTTVPVNRHLPALVKEELSTTKEVEA